MLNASLTLGTGQAGLLVLSDLHLGAALRDPMDFTAKRRVATVDRELERFLEHHRSHPSPEGRWTLVLNGDTFDFMHMDLRPEGEAASMNLAPEEYACGLNFTSQRARFKLALMAAWHRRAFAALARFVADGHQVVFVAGNHDADLAFPAVRNELVAHLAAYVPAAARASLRKRVRVARWFWIEPGRAYIEHGHRFDPYTTFHDALMPRVWGRATHLAESFCHVSSRLFLNRIRTLPIHDLDAWKLMDFVRWGFGRTGNSVWGLFTQYVSLVARLAHRAVVEERELRTRFHRRQRARLARLRAYARGSRLPIEALHELEKLGVKPISATIRGVFHALYFHHVGIGAIALLLAGLGAFLPDSGLARAVVPALVLVAAAVLFKLFALWRPDPDAHPRQGAIAARIARWTHVPIVVFGHTHKETDAPAGDAGDAAGARWLNPGAWENAWRRPRIHRAGAACTCGLRFARVTGSPGLGAGVDARLVPWCRHERAPLESS
jgi:UDP-2,3-diacylglucosamine pyrophosphatase LpxH